jgi:type III secretory pathway component EscS
MVELAYYEAFILGVRVLFLLAVPLVVAVAIAGTVISALQSATTIKDPAGAYAVRLVALVVTIYLMYPAFARSLADLVRLSWGGMS